MSYIEDKIRKYNNKKDITNKNSKAFANKDKIIQYKYLEPARYFIQQSYRHEKQR